MGGPNGQLLPQRGYLVTQRRQGTVIHKNHAGHSASFGIAGLGGDPGPGVLLSHASRLPQPGQSGPLRSLDHDDHVVPALELVLDQQGHVVHHDRGRRCSRCQRSTAPGDLRVHHTVQPLSCAVVGEHPSPEGGSVQLTIGGQQVAAEVLDDHGQSGGPRCQDRAGQLVGVDDDGTVLGQQPGHFALARPDAAGEPDTDHGRKPSQAGHAVREG